MEDFTNFLEWIKKSECPEQTLDEWEAANREQVRLLTPLVAVAPEGATEEEQSERQWALNAAEKTLDMVARAREFFSQGGASNDRGVW